MIVLFFGNKTCDKCGEFLGKLKDSNIEDKVHFFKYVDAFADDQQDFCDEHDVDELPHVKLFHDGKLLYERIGYQGSVDADAVMKIIRNGIQ